MFGRTEVRKCGEEAGGGSRVMRYCFVKRAVGMVTVVCVLLVYGTVFFRLAWTHGETRLGIRTCIYALASFMSDMCFLVVWYGCWRLGAEVIVT